MAATAEEEILRELEEEDNFEYYTLLNVARNATVEEIRSAYRRLCRIYHPDRYSLMSLECRFILQCKTYTSGISRVEY